MMKRILHIAVCVAALIAIGGCAAKKGAWAVPANLNVGDAGRIVADAVAANRLPELMEAAETRVFPTDEERMAEFLRAALATGRLDETQTQTAEWMLHDVCERNAPGTKAADFMFATEQKSSLQLDSYLPGRPLAMVFYDPDCEHCREVIDELRDLASLTDVLAVCINGNEKRWRQCAGMLPEGWVNAFDRSDIMATDTYVIRAMPSVYLLDGDHRVVLKNPSSEKLLNHLRNRK